MIAFLGERGLNTFVTMPLDAPKVRLRWSEPYDDAERARFRELYEAGRAAGVEVVAGVAPVRLLGRGGLDAREDRDGNGVNDRQWPALRDKFLALQDAGGRRFVLAFDRALASFVPAFATRRAAALHAKAARLLLFALRERDPGASLWLAPAVDHGVWTEGAGGGARYGAALARDLPPGVSVLWSGPRRRSVRIRGEVAARLARSTGLDLVVVSKDPEDDRFAGFAEGLIARRPRSAWRALRQRAPRFGPRDTLDPDLVGAVSGVLFAAPPEAELAKIPLACLAAYLDDPAAYVPLDAHAQAIRCVGGNGADDLALLYRLVQRQGRGLAIDGKTLDLPTLVEDAAGRVRRGEAAEDEVLRRVLRAVRELPERLRAASDGRALWRDAGPAAERVAGLAAAGLKALVAVEAARAGHREKARGLGREAARAVAATRRAAPLVGMGAVDDLVALCRARALRRS